MKSGQKSVDVKIDIELIISNYPKGTGSEKCPTELPDNVGFYDHVPMINLNLGDTLTLNCINESAGNDTPIQAERLVYRSGDHLDLREVERSENSITVEPKRTGEEDFNLVFSFVNQGHTYWCFIDPNLKVKQ